MRSWPGSASIRSARPSARDSSTVTTDSASAVGEIDWADYTIAIPAFLTMLMIPLTFSIANGLAFGFTAYTFLKIFRGEFRKVNAVMYILTLLFLARFYYMGKS